MDWEKIIGLIPAVIEKVRTDYILNNMIIKDDIFGILEKHCTVVYYPIENEKNCGFHTKRFVKDKLEDFVYINTAKTVADQVFAAAHELGHVWGVATQVWEQVGEQGILESKIEEQIINRFAAELLMPTKEFRKTFLAHIEKLGFDSNKLRLADLICVMVLQMNDYMVPYEAYYDVLYEDMRLTLEAVNSSKQVEKLCLHKGQTIYNTHKQGSSMGDVHMILMASYLQMPILLTEDSDIEMLRDIAKRRMRLGQYSLQILNGVQLIEKIAKKQDSSITLKEIESILKAMRERSVVSSIKTAWRENHTV